MSRKDELENNLSEVKKKIASVADHDVTLIVVTKSFPASDAVILSELGIRDFGENRDAEGAEKSQLVPATWHFQGQIQSNKLKSITQWAKVIHSLDDHRHFELIGKYATHPLSIFLHSMAHITVGERKSRIFTHLPRQLKNQLNILCQESWQCLP